MTAIGFTGLVVVVITVAAIVILLAVTCGIRREEARSTLGAAAPSVAARLTRRILGAYRDPAWSAAADLPIREGQSAPEEAVPALR